MSAYSSVESDRCCVSKSRRRNDRHARRPTMADPRLSLPVLTTQMHHILSLPDRRYNRGNDHAESLIRSQHEDITRYALVTSLQTLKTKLASLYTLFSRLSSMASQTCCGPWPEVATVRLQQSEVSNLQCLCLSAPSVSMEHQTYHALRTTVNFQIKKQCTHRQVSGH